MNRRSCCVKIGCWIPLLVVASATSIQSCKWSWFRGVRLEIKPVQSGHHRCVGRWAVEEERVWYRALNFAAFDKSCCCVCRNLVYSCFYSTIHFVVHWRRSCKIQCCTPSGDFPAWYIPSGNESAQESIQVFWVYELQLYGCSEPNRAWYWRECVDRCKTTGPQD